MPTPKPAPPKKPLTETVQVVNPKSVEKKPKPKLITFIVTLFGGEKIEIKAESAADAWNIAQEKHNGSPESIEKKPFVRAERLYSQPLRNNKKLSRLKQQMENHAPKGKRK